MRWICLGGTKGDGSCRSHDAACANREVLPQSRSPSRRPFCPWSDGWSTNRSLHYEQASPLPGCRRVSGIGPLFATR